MRRLCSGILAVWYYSLPGWKACCWALVVGWSWVAHSEGALDFTNECSHSNTLVI
jgi:hypothetical protein